jgi:hypothetical protein
MHSRCVRKIVGQRGHDIYLASVERGHGGHVVRILFHYDLSGSAEHGNGDGVADIRIEGSAIPMIVGSGKLRLLDVDAATQHTGSTHAPQHCPRVGCACNKASHKQKDD